MSIATSTLPAPTSIRGPDGKDYAVRPLSMSRIATIQRWLNSLPGPRALAAVRPLLDGLPSDAVAPIVAAAREKDEAWPPDLLSDMRVASRIIMTDPDGQLRFVAAALGVDDAEARAILDGLSLDSFGEIWRAAFGLPADDAERRVRDLAASLLEAGEGAIASDILAAADARWSGGPAGGEGGQADLMNI